MSQSYLPLPVSV